MLKNSVSSGMCVHQGMTKASLGVVVSHSRGIFGSSQEQEDHTLPLLMVTFRVSVKSKSAGQQLEKPLDQLMMPALEKP